MIERIDEKDSLVIQKAKSVILDGGLICFKSDTVYGFACDATNDKAVEKIYKLKNRPASKSIAIFVNEIAMAKKIIQFDRSLSDICDKYLPGHLTVVAKAVPDCEFNLSDKLSLESNFLGFRMIDSNFVNELITELGLPLAVTSANISGFESFLSSDEVLEILQYSDH